MSNHNSLARSSENNDDSDKDDEPSIFASVTPIGSRKPLSVNNNLINFSLSRQKEQQDRQAVFEHEKDGDETSKAEKKSKDKETDAGSTPSRRKAAGRSLRNILKRAPAQPEQPAIEQSAYSTDTEALPKPAEPESVLPKRPNLTLVGAAGAAAGANRPAHTEESVPDSTEPADTGSLAEVIPLFKSKEGDDTEAEAAMPDIDPAAAAANAAPDPPDTVVAPPPPPVPPVRPPTGGGGGAGGAGRGPAGGGNLPPIPPAVQAANFGGQPAGPNTPNPNLPNQAPVVIERGSDGWVPAVVAFLGATYFRRRGERRTNRKIEKTNKDLAETQSQVEAERRRTRGNEQRALEQRDRDRRAAPIIPLASTGNNRAEASPAGPAEQPVNIVNNYSETAPQASGRPEDLPASPEAAQRLEKQAESMIRPVKAAEVVAGSVLAREISQHEAVKKEVLKEADEARAAERQWRAAQAPETIRRPLNEAGLDRRHETRGDPALSQRLTPLGFQSQAGLTAAGRPATGSTDDSTASHTSSNGQSQPSGSTPQDIYKKSMRAGFVTGISVIVLGILAFLLLN